MGAATTMKGFSSLGEAGLSEKLKVNLISFLEYGFLDKGGFFNVSLSDVTGYDGDRSVLRRVDDPYFTNGQVWQAHRYPWTWQSGLSTSTQPIRVSGVYVGGTFYPTSTVGAFAHSVDYTRGRIIFDTAIATTSSVTAEYSYPWINVVSANDVPIFKQTQFESQRTDDSHFSNVSSGEWYPLHYTRVQLPTVAVSVVKGRRYTGFALGRGHNAHTDVLFHVLAEDEPTASKLADFISYQEDKTIFLFNIDDMGAQNRFPLTFDGAIASGALTYPQLVQKTEAGGFRWRKLTFSDTIMEDGQRLHQNLYKSSVRMTTEVTIVNI